MFYNVPERRLQPEYDDQYSDEVERLTESPDWDEVVFHYTVDSDYRQALKELLRNLWDDENPIAVEAVERWAKRAAADKQLENIDD